MTIETVVDRKRNTSVLLNQAHPGDAGLPQMTTANFAVWRFQYEATDVYVGRYVNVLVRGPAPI